MTRFTHKVTGVVVSVDDDKELSSDWEREGDKPKRAGKKTDDKS